MTPTQRGCAQLPLSSAKHVRVDEAIAVRMAGSVYEVARRTFNYQKKKSEL